METKVTETTAQQIAPVLGDFYPLETVYPPAPNAIFNSEHSARWFLRVNRTELLESSAIAIHAGRMLVNPEKFLAVAKAVAIRAASNRHQAHEQL